MTYRHFVSYAHGTGFGSREINSSTEMLSSGDLKEISRIIKISTEFENVVILNTQLLRDEE